MQFEADYYDGISPRAKRVLVNVVNNHFIFKTSLPNTKDALSSNFQRYAINSCDVQTKLGSGKRLIDLPDNGRLETDYQRSRAVLTSEKVKWLLASRVFC